MQHDRAANINHLMSRILGATTTYNCCNLSSPPLLRTTALLTTPEYYKDSPDDYPSIASRLLAAEAEAELLTAHTTFLLDYNGHDVELAVYKALGGKSRENVYDAKVLITAILAGGERLIVQMQQRTPHRPR